MWLKRRKLIWCCQASGHVAMTRTDAEANGICRYRNTRRRAGGNHTLSGSQSREGVDCSQDGPRMTKTPGITVKGNQGEQSRLADEPV